MFQAYYLNSKRNFLLSLNESNDKLRDELKAKALENQELQHQIETSRNQIICNYEVKRTYQIMINQSTPYLDFKNIS